MRLDLTPDELLSTTRAVRRRLDFERPVERAVLVECLDLATQAPSGSNRQGWHWVFVTDPAKKQAVADIYREVFEAVYHPGRSDPRVYASAAYLAEHFHEVPVMMIPCQSGRPTGDGNQAGFWGSLLPAAWNFCLAARERGLGTAWTTMHLTRERDVADVLGIPYDDVIQGGLFPVAYTLGTDFKRGPRKSMDDIVHWDTWSLIPE
ncbi:MAG: nitroreductase family protein [Acidimicrobiia bacterium]